jgi:ParB family chromosome partitioning protein
MRHDTHFVDHLLRPADESIGRMVPIEDLEPNPRQPRQSLGDLSDLVASIRAKGVLEPLLVRKLGGRYQIIAGERRYRAAVEAGLGEVPCVVRDSTDGEMMELALVENLQRKDLSAFEEADGLTALAQSYGYTHEMMADRIGKSRTSITETLALAAMPERVRQMCRLADIQSKSILLQIVRQGSPEKMVGLVQRLQSDGGATRAEARRLARSGPAARGRGRPRHHSFTYESKDQGFRLSLQFKRPEVGPEEIVRALETTLEAVRRGDRR